MKFMKQLWIILGISFLAEVIEYLMPIPVSASVYGLVLMLICLMTGIVTVKKVEKTANLLVEIMPILFVPPAVGIITAGEELIKILVPLCVICLVSTLLVMGVTGRLSQAVIRSSKRKETKIQEEKVSQ